MKAFNHVIVSGSIPIMYNMLNLTHKVTRSVFKFQTCNNLSHVSFLSVHFDRAQQFYQLTCNSLIMQILQLYFSSRLAGMSIW
jgi:hypothetical protein